MAGDRFVRGNKDKISQAENTRGYGYQNFPQPAPPPAVEPEITVTPEPEPKPKPSKVQALLSKSSSLLAIPAGRTNARPQTVIVGRSEVAVWSEQSFLSQRLGEVRSGENLTVVEEEDGWLYIRYGTQIEGWVRSAELGAYQNPYEGLGDRSDLI